MPGAVFAIRGADDVVKRLEAAARAATDWMPKKAASMLAEYSRRAFREPALRPEPWAPLAPGTIAYTEECMEASDFSGIRFAYAYFLRDMVGLALLEGREADARAYYGRLAGFFEARGLGAEMPAFEDLPAADPEFVTDLLDRAGLK